jgi:hypothetical protein
MNTTRLIGVIAVLLVGLLSAQGCGMHVSSDPVRVEHKHSVTFDPEALINYCEMVCAGEGVCFEDCARRFIDLLGDPDICAELNFCAQ